MISVITPLYNTHPDILERTWTSLKQQTNPDWQWVVWDDSTVDTVWPQVRGFASDNRFKIVAHRSMSHSGSIGRLKRQAFMAAEGDILVELDHDDELTPDCLDHVLAAFSDPEIGFVYSDWCEILPDGQSGVYPPGWAFGYGSEYWSEQYGVWVMSAPPINPTTIRHIVSAPNHVRAWRSSVYHRLNGHNPNLTIADDYDLVVRTFLATKFHHIPKLLYKQYIGPTTAQRVRNELIQEYVAKISAFFDPAITRRFDEL